jgi:nitric oxide reductase NorE protein
MTSATDSPNAAPLLEPPGGLFIWMLVALELATFGVALIAFAVSAKSEPALFLEGRQALDVRLGFANTFFLLTSGYFMAEGVRRFHRGELPRARRALAFALGGGGLFMIAKGVEYAGKIEAGRTLGSDPFFTWYWLLTVFHLMHVIVGMVILAVLIRRLDRTTAEGLEAGGVFWHMCDLVWLLLFPALYLVS